MIQNTTVTADKNPSYETSPGNDTTDKVFLLSAMEAGRYFDSNLARKCAPTDYAVAQGAHKSRNGSCRWWLRSPGIYSSSAADVDLDGSVYDYGNVVDRGDVAVRPALWLNLGS